MQQLATVTLLEGLQEVGECARCVQQPTSVTLPEGLKVIKNYAFCGCSSLASVTPPEGPRRSERYFMDAAAHFRDLQMGSRRSESGHSMVQQPPLRHPAAGLQGSERRHSECSNLTSVILPEGLKVIEDYAFYGCSSLTSVTLPEGLKVVGDYAFEGCSSLTSATLPKGLQELGKGVFCECTALPPCP